MSDQIEYVDFEVNILKTDGGEYIVQVNSMGGRAEARFSDLFSDDKRALIRQTLTTAALRSSARVRSSSASEVNTMKDFGVSLFDQAMRERVREFYNQCLGQANNQGKGLRLRLSVDPSLQELPWEFLATPQKTFLALNPRTPVVRYVEVPTTTSPLKTELPLRILVVIASPKDQTALDTAAEKGRIAAALDPLQEQGLVKVNYIEGPDTWTRLIDAMRPNEIHILHFIGHGAFDPANKEGVLVMENEDGSSMYIPSELTRILLEGKTRLRLVVLNACLGTQAEESQPLSSVASGMVYAGVPAVIAMQFEVSDTAAQTIASTFYKSLALNFPVDAALTEARRQIALLNRDSLEWATPVLFMQVPDGQLFDIRQPENRPVPKPEGAITTGQMDNVIEILYQRAEQSYKQQKWEDALKNYRMVSLQSSNYKQTIQRIAEIEKFQSGASPAPAEAQAPAIDWNARAAERYKMGEEAITRGEWEEAIKAFQGVLLAVPDYRDAAQRLAYCERRLQCVKLYDQAQEAYRSKQFTRVLDTMIQIHNIEPRWVDSADLENLAECGQLYMRALGALRNGDRNGGAEQLRALLAKKPEFEDAASRLENLLEGGSGLFGEAPLQQHAQSPTSNQPRPIPVQKPGGAVGVSRSGGRPVPATQAAPKPPPANLRTYELPGADIHLLADELHQYFMSQTYQTQILDQGPALMVQGRKEETWRTLLGMSYAATIVIEPSEGGFKVSVGGGKWVDKAAIAAFGMFVALGFTVLTAGYGATQQKALENNLWGLIERHVSQRGGKRIA